MDVESKETIEFAIDHAKAQFAPVIADTIRQVEVAARALIDETFANVFEVEVHIGPITIPEIVLKVKRGKPPQP